MRNLLAVAFAIPLFTACTVGDDPTQMMGDDMHPDPMPMPMPTGDGLEGTIQANTTWTGVQRVKAEVTIPAGVTVTMAAGAGLDFASGVGLKVQGTLKIEGTSAGKVVLKPETGATYWQGISVTGTLDVKYGDFTSGAINTSGAAASLIIVDTKMFKAGGDYIIMNGGTINMTYSQVGAAVGQTDSTHCNLHINAASTITVTNSNINGAPFGVMFYGGVGANFQNNNWYDSGTATGEGDVATQSGVSGNFSGGYFKRGAPCQGAAPACPGAQITATGLSATMLTNAGPRP